MAANFQEKLYRRKFSAKCEEESVQRLMQLLYCKLTNGHSYKKHYAGLAPTSAASSFVAKNGGHQLTHKMLDAMATRK
jgi:hypothetical protein